MLWQNKRTCVTQPRFELWNMLNGADMKWSKMIAQRSMGSKNYSANPHTFVFKHAPFDRAIYIKYINQVGDLLSCSFQSFTLIWIKQSIGNVCTEDSTKIQWLSFQYRNTKFCSRACQRENSLYATVKRGCGQWPVQCIYISILKWINSTLSVAKLR